MSLEYGAGEMDIGYLWSKIAYLLLKMNRKVSREVFKISIHNIPGHKELGGIDRSTPSGDD